MLEIGDKVKIKESNRVGYVYDTFIDSRGEPYYHLVWYPDDLNNRWASYRMKALYWQRDLVVPKFRVLKNNVRIITSL